MSAVFVLRIGFMLFFTLHTDLAGDEAYYWDWGRQPDWGYFSKPPMIGWLMAVIGWLTGNAEWGIRFAALLFGTGTLAAVFVLARRLYGARTAFLATGLMLLTPGNAALNLLFTIDAPLLLTWCAALLLFWSCTEKPQHWGRWIALALVVGVGTLSKQMMLVFPGLMIAFAFVSKSDRALLQNPRFWLSIVVGTAFIAPVLWWNQQHQWITLEHTKHHFDAKSLSFGKWLGRTFEFPGVQALLYSPVTFAALLAVLGIGVKRWRQMERRERFLLLFSAPALAGFALLALRQRINPNWPAVFYVPAFILAAAWMQGLLGAAAHPAWRRWSLRIGAAFVLVIHLAMPVVFLTQLKGHKKLSDLRGWKEAGEQAGAFLEKVPRKNNTFVLALGHRYTAAQFAFYMPQHPRTYRWEPSGVPMSQYEVWPGPEERIGDDALIIYPGTATPAPLIAPIAERFEKIEPLGRIEVPLGAVNRSFDVFLGRNLLNWKPVVSSSRSH